MAVILPIRRVIAVVPMPTCGNAPPFVQGNHFCMRCRSIGCAFCTLKLHSARGDFGPAPQETLIVTGGEALARTLRILAIGSAIFKRTEDSLLSLSQYAIGLCLALDLESLPSMRRNGATLLGGKLNSNAIVVGLARIENAAELAARAAGSDGSDPRQMRLCQRRNPRLRSPRQRRRVPQVNQRLDGLNFPSSSGPASFYRNDESNIHAGTS